MDYLKYTRLAPPIRPIVSSRGSITYRVAKELANIIHTLVGQSPHHLENTQQFVENIKKVKLESGEDITSYDLKATFTSVPMDPSITIAQCKLQQDPYPPIGLACPLQIITLLEFCLKNTYFLFQGKYYEQVQGAAMGSPIRPLLPTCLWKSQDHQFCPQPLIYNSCK